ncbi:MAG: glycosyltransferase [Silicimonas sp.]|nr:glycosyltransferase [Silicimonas sp.]
MLTKLIDGGRRILDQDKLIRESGLFDADWYAERYPAAGSAEKALAYFLKVGADKGHNPGPRFSTGAYLADNPDVRESGAIALLHYLRFGQFEGRMVRDTHGRPSGLMSSSLGDEADARLRAAFNTAHYRDTNPDLPEDADHFAHFMGPGWRQGRDPAKWFSVEQYLRDNRDVAESGQNPFVHYLLTGCREGRRVTPSLRPVLVDETDVATRPRLGVVAMVRNEADIIRVFTAHLIALFDEIVIVDHCSDDGTAEYLAALAGENHRVECLTLKEPSYIQSVTMTHVVRDRPQLRDVDWLFFLDADEFLPFSSRAEFLEGLERFQKCPVIAMHWCNLIPDTYWDGETTITGDTSFLSPPAPSPFRKIAFQPRRIALDRTLVAQGNHALIETLNGLELPSFEVDFPLLHLPVRSSDQLVLKLNQGVLAYQKIGAGRDKGQGTHRYQMKEATAGTSLTADHLNAVIDRYSEPKDAILPLSKSELLAAGYQQATYNLAWADPGLSAPESRPLGEQLMRILAVDYSKAASQDTLSATRLKTNGTALVRAEVGPEYCPLPRKRKASKRTATNDALKDLMRASYRDIDDLVASDWSGHIPFMFAVAALCKPRRYVELGTLRGASFFAFGQAVLQGGFASEAIAVSSWAVESERSEDFQNVYEDFLFLARKYADFSGHLRMGQEQAQHRFAKGSIDLLHLDGFYDYDGLKVVLDDWMPKLSNSGMLMLHDIHVHEGDFGVWRIWEELVAEHPTIEFRHSQGLGLACIGSEAPEPLMELARATRSDPALQTMLQEHFSRMGAMSSELFSRRYDMARLEMRSAAEGAQAEELTWLRQELASARSEADDLREMVQRRLSRAAG